MLTEIRLNISHLLNAYNLQKKCALLSTIFIISFIALSATNSFAQGLLKVQINDFSGGQNSNDLADILQPNQGTSVKNAVINRKGRISKRKGQDLIVEDVGSTAFTGLGRFDPDTSTSFIVAASGVSIIRALKTDTSYILANPDNNLSTGQDTEFVQANKLLFVLNGQDNTSWYDGSVWTPGAGLGSASPPSATTGVWLRNYLFVAGRLDQPDWVNFSNNLAPETFTVSDVFKVNTGDGQKIQKLMAFKLNELIIYKERSIYDLDITGSTPLSDWTLQPITTVIGTIAPRSVVRLGNDQWFLSSDPIAVRSLVRSQFDKILTNMVSDPVQDIFDGTGDLAINKSQINKAAAILFDNKYILSIPTGSSTVNNTVLVHDFITKSWYIISGWFPAQWVVFDNRLFYMDANDGRVIECFVGNIGDFAEGPTFIDSASDPTVGINYEFISKDIDFDNVENFKHPDAIEVEFDTTGSFDATISIDLDNNGFNQIGTIDLSGDVITLPVNLPFTLQSGGIARKTFHIQQFNEFKKMRVKVEQSGVSEPCILHRISIFSKVKKWRRE